MCNLCMEHGIFNCSSCGIVLDDNNCAKIPTPYGTTLMHIYFTSLGSILGICCDGCGERINIKLTKEIGKMMKYKNNQDNVKKRKPNYPDYVG